MEAYKRRQCLLLPWKQQIFLIISLENLTSKYKRELPSKSHQQHLLFVYFKKFPSKTTNIFNYLP
jgi:hypothetical protein